jgi:membrane-associated phospholipid phosphatase
MTARSEPQAAARSLRPGPSRARWALMGAAILVIIAGFLGLDRWFYEHVSLTLDAPDRYGNRDFYAATKLFWLLCRYAFGYGVIPLAILAGLVVVRPESWRKPVVGALAIVAAALVANGAQAAIGRLRPNQAATHLAFTQPFAELLTKQKVSFPSGEAATALAAAYVLARLLPRWKAAFYATAALAAVARLVNGAHYLSDVVAGALLGYALGALVFHWGSSATERRRS